VALRNKGREKERESKSRRTCCKCRPRTRYLLCMTWPLPVRNCHRGRGPKTCQRWNLSSGGGGTREGQFDKNEAEKESATKSGTTVELLFHLNNNWMVAKVSCLTCLAVRPGYVVGIVANEDGLS
jgi:hypothetical protein